MFDTNLARQSALSIPSELLPLSQFPTAGGSGAVMFVDRRVADFESLIAGTTAEVFVLDADQDGIAQISQVLAGRRDLSAIHIVSHGSAGDLLLGQSGVNQGSLGEYEAALVGWRSALTEDADILLYGCEVGQGSAGLAFVQRLAEVTGADVAASDDLTGNAALGGDWDLEVTQGTINTALTVSSSAIAQYQHILPIGPDGGGYIATSTALQSIDLVPGNAGVVNTGLVGDDPIGLPINLGSSTFRFYGQTYTGANQLFVNANGLITFGAGIYDFINTDFTSLPSQAAIGVAWDDWRADNGGSVLYQFRDLNADSTLDELIIEWSTVPHFSNVSSGNATFQAILQLNTGPANGNIIFNYPDMQIASTDIDETGSATIAIKAAGVPGTNRLPISINSTSSPLVGTGRAVLITGRSPVIDLNGDLDQTTAGIDYAVSFAVRIQVQQGVEELRE